MYVELLAESDSYAYVRTSEGGAGAYDCGDFGFLPIANLSLAQTSQSIGVAQADDGDLPVVVLGDPDDEKSVIGALCSGAQARITSYTQTDYVQIFARIAGRLCEKSQIRVLTAPNEPLSDRIPQRATTKTDVDIRFAGGQGRRGGNGFQRCARICSASSATGRMCWRVIRLRWM